jgi:ribosome biogenesis GTPase
MDLQTLGWDSAWSEEAETLLEGDLVPGRVAVAQKTGYGLYTESGEVWAELLGRMRFEAEEGGDLPVVGDWVGVALSPDARSGVIHTILPRRSFLARKAVGRVTARQLLAANIDTAFWVESLNEIFKLRRIERFLLMAAESGADPAVILNKADLCDNAEEKVREVKAIAPDIPVHPTSAFSQIGLEDLKSYIRDGKTVVFLGMSGVGKSTILNQLAGGDLQETGEIRQIDGRGRHTTSTRSLFVLPEGGCAIDSPGIRELALWDDSDNIYGAFPDIEEIAAGCRFKDCGHDEEPSCAVRQAVEDGLLAAGRFENFKKMKKELKHLEKKRTAGPAYDKKRELKQMSKMIRRYKRDFNNKK